MNRHEKVETPYSFSEDIIGGGSHRSSKFGVLFPEPGITNYSLHVGVVPRQPHQSHYRDSFLESPAPSSQLMQSGISQDLLYRTVSNLGSLENLQFKQGNSMFNDQTIPDKIDSFGKSQSKLGNSLFADCHAQRSHKGITLKPKNTAEFACRNTNMEKVLTSSWRELAGFEHRGNNDASNTWMVSTGFQNIVQSEGAAAGKQRIRWTHELHDQFVEAVNSLGGAMKATPKGILRLMGSQGLTIFHIKSHLQKYRNPKFIPDYLEGKNGRRANQDATLVSNPNGNAEFQISEALRLQMDVQKNLHDHLEFQKKLQKRIEEHANYLRRMFDQQSTSHTFSESHNSDKAIDPTFTECSSIEGIGDHGKMFITKVDP